MHRYSVIACARWETPYIAEWLAYYAVIGFDHIYLYCNDDDPSELAAEVASATRVRPDFVSFTHFPGQGQQRAMYLDALRMAREESEWITFLDIDEFLVLRGADDIAAFMSGVDPSTDSVHFNWTYFGNSGFIERPPGSVLRQYTWRSAMVNAHTKHLTRSRFLDPERVEAPAPYPFWHGLADPVWAGVRRVNVLGADVGPHLSAFPASAVGYVADREVSRAIISRAVVNHYAFKSEEDFMFRVRRGTGGQFSSQADWEQKYKSGFFHTILDGMSEAEDTYLRDFATRVLADGSALAQPRGPAPPLRISMAHHRLWSAPLVFGGNGRVRHSKHGSLGSYSRVKDTITIKWDDWPDQNLFFEQEGILRDVFGQLSPGQTAVI